MSLPGPVKCRITKTEDAELPSYVVEISLFKHGRKTPVKVTAVKLNEADLVDYIERVYSPGV